MDKQHFTERLQKYLEDVPLIVLGSGASVPYGLPSMQKLAEQILKDDLVKRDPQYEVLKKKVDTSNLEVALNQSSLAETTHGRIKIIIWEFINKADIEFFKTKGYKGNIALSQLFTKLLGGSSKNCTVVTTNYDRIAEYAAGHANCICVTGFIGELIKKFNIDSCNFASRNKNEKMNVVSIWKVHGSLDWFEVNRNLVAYPSCSQLLDGHTPLIIPPSKDKYRCTAGEPFRDLINKADQSFKMANCFLCYGYGFNDEHIEPKLIAQAKLGKPIVVIAKKLTDKCKEIFLDRDSFPKFILMEEEEKEIGINRTKIYTNSTDNQEVVEQSFDGSFWNLEELLKIW